MGVLAALLVWAGLMALAALCWKRLLGLAVTRFAHGRAFRLSVGEFCFGGLADLTLVLHVGPVRELRIERLAVGLTAKGAARAAAEGGGGSDGGGAAGGAGLAGLWQALLAGQLLLPVRLHGLALVLAPPPPPPEPPARRPASLSVGGAAGTAPRRARRARPPLWLLAHVPVQLEGVLVVDEARGVQVSLRRASLALHSAEQLSLEGLACALLHAAVAGGGSPPASLRAGSGPDAGSSREPLPFFRLERLRLEHSHDGGFGLQHIAAAPSAIGGPGAPSAPALQSLSVQLGATSLALSDRLLHWAQQRQAEAAAARRQRSATQQQQQQQQQQQDQQGQQQDQQQDQQQGQQDQQREAKQPRLLRLLALLPREIDATVHSCSLSCSEAADGLPLCGAFGLRGIKCRLTKGGASASAGSHGDGDGNGGPSVSVAAGWQQLAFSLGAADSGRQDALPAAVAVSSGAAEWSLELAPAQGRAAAPQLSAAAVVTIGALNTDVCHPAVQPLVRQLRLAVAAAKAATARPAKSPAADAGVQGEAPLPPVNGGAASAAAPALAEWQASVSLGDGSRLLFTDAAGRCRWSSGLASCRLAARHASGGALSADFEALGIEMHAAATAADGPAAAQGDLGAAPPPQMLSAQLLRLQVEHSPPQQQQQQQQQLQEEQQAERRGGTAIDATTSGVHLLLQQQQLAQVASVVVSLLPTPDAVPGEASSGGAPDGLAAVTAAAAAGQAARRRAPLPRLAFACADTLLLLPTTVAVPAEQTADGALALLPAAPALLLSSVSGTLGGGGGGGSVAAEGCSLLHCEGAQSQRFPASTDALKEVAKVAVVSVDRAAFRQGAGAAPPADAPLQGAAEAPTADGADGGADRALELGVVAACANADALLCLAAAADSAARQLAPVLAAARRGVPAERRPRAASAGAPARPLALAVAQLRLAQPLYAPDRCRDLAIEVTDVHAAVGEQRGCQHSLRAGAAVLSIAGTPVLRWRSADASLRLPEAPGGRLAAPPLPSLPAPDGDEASGDELEEADWPAGDEDGFGAYERARLEAWLEADAATAPARLAPRDAAAAALGAGPASLLDATLDGAELVVPHDGEPGPTERYAELYFKALQAALEPHVRQVQACARRLKGSGADERGGDGSAWRPAGGRARRPSLFPMQISLAATAPALRFEHHPLEAWLASRGPLLQQLAVQQHLWGEAAAAVQPADTASPLHAGMVESAFETVAAASQQAWQGLMRDLLLLYRSKLRQADAQAEGPPGGDGDGGGAGGAVAGAAQGGVRAPPGHDLMMISVERLRALLVVCAGSDEARAAARRQIAAADPPSELVPMSKMVKLHADVALRGFSMRLAGTARPFVAASAARLSGTAAVARQATAPPQTRERRLPLGTHRVVSIPATVKGCRPPFKFFTDLRLEAGHVAVCHSQGLDPLLALVGLAGKRLAPSDPDRTAPRAPPIPWWDDMRYMWRGPASVAAASLALTLGGTAAAAIGDGSERMEVEAEQLRGSWTSGRCELELQALRSAVYRSAGVQQLGGTLLELPLLAAPAASVRLEVAPKLPGGRPPEQHHLFPLELPPPGALQPPVYAGVAYRAESWDLALRVELGRPEQEAPGGPEGPAVGHLGGHQIQWLKQFVGVMNRLPPQLRAVSRRGTYFWRKPPPAPGPPKRGLGKLTQKFCLDVAAAPLEIVHFAADPADPSHGIHLHAPACRYSACYLFNQPLPSFLRLPPHARSGRGRPEPTRTLTLGMDVAAASVTVHKADAQRRPAGGGGGRRGASPRGGPGGGAAALAAAWGEVEGAMLGLLDDAAAPVTRGEEPIISAGSVAVSQEGQEAPAPGGGDGLAAALGAPPPPRPLRVAIADCRVLADRAARDSVWAAVEHLVSAFTTAASQQRLNLRNAAVHTLYAPSTSPTPSPALTTSPSMPWSLSSPVAQLQRHVSEAQSARSTPQPGAQPGDAPGGAGARASLDGAPAPAPTPSPAPQPSPAAGDSGSDLLALLLQQKAAAEEAGGPADGSPRDGQAGGQAGADGVLHPGAAQEEEEEEEEQTLVLGGGGGNLQAGRLKYDVEVRDLQITAETEAAQGRLLLAARRGRLQGLHSAEAGLSVTALLMEQVACYITQTDVDPDAPVSWLLPGPDGYQLPAGPAAMAPLRRVFEPIQISLRHSKASAATRSRHSAPLPRGRRSPDVSFTAAGLRGEELIVRVPKVLAVMDSREFEVLVEVVAMLQSPGPSVDSVGAEAALLAELEGDEVEEARRLYALLRQQLAELRLASLSLRASLGLQEFVSWLEPAVGAPPGLLPPLGVRHFLADDDADFVAVQFGTAAELTVAMREHLAAASAAAADAAEAAAAARAPDADGAPPAGDEPRAAGRGGGAAAARRRLGERQREAQRALLLRWVEEQEGGGYEAVERAKSCLLALKAVARKRQHKTSATRLRLHLDHCVWQMVSASREPFVTATLRGLLLDKLKDRDHSGSSKFVIGRMEVLDSTGALGAGPGIGPGVILAPWNPDASWARDDVLRVVARMGPPTQTHVVYDHLDLILHPIAFHLTEGIAVAFWEYFFPREGESKARAAKAFARSVAVPAAAAARHRRSATALPAEASYSQQGSPMAGSSSPLRRPALVPPGDGSQPGSGQQSPRASAGTPRAASIVNAGWRSAPSKLHRRTSSVTADGNLSRQSTLGASSAAAAAADAALVDGGPEAAAAALARTSAASCLARTSATGPLEAAATLAGGRLYRPLSHLSLSALDADSTAARAAAPPPPHRDVRFSHVKVNRAHCRATYEGYPLTFTDLKLVIDNRTYSGVEGRWRDLFNRMKWDIVKSVVKSVAGLQGRKFKELLPEGLPGDEGEGGGRRKTGLLASLQALGKGRKEGGDAAAEPGLSREDLRAQHKRRMLFGQMPPTPGGGAAPTLTMHGAGAGQPAPGAASPPVRRSPGGTPPPARSPVASPAGASAADSGGTTPRSDVAGGAESFPPPLPAGPLASGAAASAMLSGSGTASGGAFGSMVLPDVEPAASGGADGAGADAGPHSTRGSLPTPRWAAKLASKASKGLSKLRDSLQE